MVVFRRILERPPVLEAYSQSDQQQLPGIKNSPASTDTTVRLCVLKLLKRHKPGPMPSVPADITPSGSFHQFLKDMRGTYRLGNKHNLPLLTAAVAFLSLFAACPLLILSFVAGEYLIGGMASLESSQQLAQLIETLMPAALPSVSQDLVSLMKQNAVTNVVTVVVLAWSTYELFTGLQTVFAKISVRGTDRNLFWSHVISVMSFIIVFGASSLFLVLSTTSETTFRMLLSFYYPDITFPSLKPIATLISLMTVIGSITLIFKLMPTQRVSFIHAFRGSLLFIALFLMGRAFYELYAAFYRFWNKSFYGNFLSVFIVIVWIYYLSRIFLFSAQYSIFLEEKRRR